MNRWQIAIKSLFYFRRTNLAIALGVAAATAVLTGALIVGDSMRNSLRELTLERLGMIDELMLSDGFFAESLAETLSGTTEFKENYTQASSAILFPGGTVQNATDSTRRAGQVTVLGITKEFWEFEQRGELNRKDLDENSIIINQAVADDLQISNADVESGNALITVRIPKRNQLPADSALGKKNDLIESIVDLKVIQIVPMSGLGRFGLYPSQADPYNVYVSIKLLQDSLARSVLQHKSDSAQANIILISGKGQTLPTEIDSEQLRLSLRPSLEDYGLTLKRATQTFSDGNNEKTVFDYWSLSSDRLVLSDEVAQSTAAAFPSAMPIFTYLANDIRRPEADSGIPFSMIAAVDFDHQFDPISALTNDPIRPMKANEIVLNQWAADDLNAAKGDSVVITFFEPETTHGSQKEKSVELTVVDIAKLTEPDKAFRVSRRGQISPAEFKQCPTLANDPNLTPEVPGVTDAQSIENWDLPFDTADKIRPQDDDYWGNHRTTPKAFVSLAMGQKLWDSRFGNITSFRIPISAGSEEQVSEALLTQFIEDNAKLGMHLIQIKRQGIAASSGSTPFDFLFLALSMFVIGAALILVSLLFRLGLQQRASELGLMKAIGFPQKQIRRICLYEMASVSCLGATIGISLGMGYAWLMIFGLKTWWVGAISRPFLSLHISPLSLGIGFFSGLIICVLTIAWALRRTRNQPVHLLISGQLESIGNPASKTRRTSLPIIAVLALTAVGLTVAATQLAGEAQAGSFLGAGFLILASLLMWVYRTFRTARHAHSFGRLNLSRLAIMSFQRNPLRSTLTIGLVAVACFLIAAVSSFRLTPSERGTAGFEWVAQSSQPIYYDLNNPEGQALALGAENKLREGTEISAMRLKPGEDASCNNLYQSSQPRILGVAPQFIDEFDEGKAGRFAWSASLASTELEKQNPWRLLDSPQPHLGTQEDPIPVVIDKNTANYSLKIYILNTVKQIEYDSGESIYIRVVGFLENTLLQGSLIISEQDFESVFPTIGGYQYFLIREMVETTGESESDIAVLEERLSDQGFDARSAEILLGNFMSVQNTYISTFQTLGSLGLLLGTFGLAAVQIRSVLERKKELGLMRAIGFQRNTLAKMVVLENAWLLIIGLGIGIFSALFTTIPHWLVGTATAPWLELSLMFGVIITVGLLVGFYASRIISKTPLLESLRT
ncbi:FtsX-like permease family protein [Mariniblastus sp.]|nr:FtsX-like permease family protein [bacterium]MDA7903103.1 FtsX-like permease family protein [Mariniblastus sp.]